MVLVLESTSALAPRAVPSPLIPHTPPPQGHEDAVGCGWDNREESQCRWVNSEGMDAPTSYQTKTVPKASQRALCWSFPTEGSVQAVEAAMVLDPARPLTMFSTPACNVLQDIGGPAKSYHGSTALEAHRN